MKVANLPQFLRSHTGADVVVAFDDGDRYPAEALDLQGENEDGEFEIYAAFKDCLGESLSRARALAAGTPERFPGIWWTSDRPREPVGVTYTLGRIVSVYDGDRGYFVFERRAEVEP